MRIILVTSLGTPEIRLEGTDSVIDVVINFALLQNIMIIGEAVIWL